MVGLFPTVRASPGSARRAEQVRLLLRRELSVRGVWSALGVLAPAPALRFEPVDGGIETGGEPFVAVVDSNVFAEGTQTGEGLDRQRPEERVEVDSDRGVADPLFVDGGGAAEGEAGGVVVEQGEG
jgi:hypothetical protein